MQEGKWIEKGKKLQNKEGKDGKPTSFYRKSTYRRRRLKHARQVSSTAIKSSWKTTEVTVKGLRKGEMIEEVNDEEEHESFVWLE